MYYQLGDIRYTFLGSIVCIQLPPFIYTFLLLSHLFISSLIFSRLRFDYIYIYIYIQSSIFFFHKYYYDIFKDKNIDNHIYISTFTDISDIY